MRAGRQDDWCAARDAGWGRWLGPPAGPAGWAPWLPVLAGGAPRGVVAVRGTAARLGAAQWGAGSTGAPWRRGGARNRSRGHGEGAGQRRCGWGPRQACGGGGAGPRRTSPRLARWGGEGGPPVFLPFLAEVPGCRTPAQLSLAEKAQQRKGVAGSGAGAGGARGNKSIPLRTASPSSTRPVFTLINARWLQQKKEAVTRVSRMELRLQSVATAPAWTLQRAAHEGHERSL